MGADASALARYVDAWNARDLDRWLDLHHPHVEYVSLAGGEPNVYGGHDGLREVWGESDANWERFQLTVVHEAPDGVTEVEFRGTERQAGSELGGTIFFKSESSDGRIERLLSALDADRLR